MIYIDDSIEEIKRAAEALKTALTHYERGKETFKRAPVNDLLRAWVMLDKAHDALDTARKAMNAEIEHVSKSVIPERFEREGIKTTTVTNIPGSSHAYRITVGQRTSATVLDKEAAFQWLRDEGHGGLIKEVVDPKTLASFANALLEDQNIELPDGLFKVGKAPYTSATKVKA